MRNRPRPSPRRIIARLLREKPNAVLGLATGSTPLLLYRALARMKLDWRKVTTFNLDEYVGLPKEHPQSYHHFMWENLFRHVNISLKKTHIPDGMTKDVPKFLRAIRTADRCRRWDRFAGAGHWHRWAYWFQRAHSSLASRTRIKTLTPQTRKDNARFFGSADKVPHHVITMGLGSIMEARQCVMLAFGSKKARAVAAAVEGPITANVPASILQMHPNVKVCVDKGAAGKLKRTDYYHWVSKNKPDWQTL